MPSPGPTLTPAQERALRALNSGDLHYARARYRWAGGQPAKAGGWLAERGHGG